MSSSRAPLDAWPWRLIHAAAAGAGQARGTLRVWLWWEAFTLRWWQVRPARAGGLLGFSTKKHRGPRVALRDGTVITRGCLLIELHLDNRRLLATAREPAGIPWQAMRVLDADLDALAGRMSEPALRDAVALHGVTVLATAARRLGFEVHPVRHTLGAELMRYFFVGLLAIYHPEGWRHVERVRHALWPGEVWLSRAAVAARREG